MKFGFKHIILAAALMSAGSLTAQEQNDKHRSKSTTGS